jgi:ATP-dependent protease ClpP protease subunit
MTIQIDGVIGLDVTARDIRAQLDEAGDEVEILVNSPGGSVTEGVAVYNAIRDYRRSGGEVIARVVGMAASIASYIPLAADIVAVEDNTTLMIHEPSMIALGRKADMERAATILEGVSQTLARAYASKTGKSSEEMRALMADETFLFGQQIVDAGFADIVTGAETGPESQDEAFALTRAAVDDAEKRMSEIREDVTQLAAMLGEMPIAQKQDSTTVVDGESHTKARPQAGKERGALMNKEQLKNEYPDLYAEIKAEGRDEETRRRDELDGYVEAHADNPHVAEVVAEAKANGKTAWEINAKLTAAIQKGSKLDGENPPTVATASDDMDGLDDDDREAMRLMAMTESEYLEARAAQPLAQRIADKLKSQEGN